MTRIDVISGFLGAGKTTLLKKLIADAYGGERLVLIENEFGTVGIDGTFMRDTGIEISELNAGCICCSMAGDFTSQLKTTIEWGGPNRVLIEPSGVAKLSDIRRSIVQVQRACQEDEVHLNSLTTVVDATRYESYIQNFDTFYLDQIAYARCIVLSHTEVLSQEALTVCAARLRTYNATATIITTPWAEIGAAQLRQAIEGADNLATELEQLRHSAAPCCPTCGGHHSHAADHSHHGCTHNHGKGQGHCASDIFVSWGVETPQRFSEEGLLKMLEALQNTSRFGAVLRAKGAVAGLGQRWHYFDYVPGAFKLRDGAPAVTGRICVIGTGLLQEELNRLFCA